MMKIRRMMVGVATTAVMVAGFMIPAAFAEQHVMCLKQIRAEVTTQLPGGWWQTPQVGSLVKKQIGNIGGKQTLMCGYAAYNTVLFIMHEFPAGVKECRPDSEGFVCR